MRSIYLTLIISSVLFSCKSQLVETSPLPELGSCNKPVEIYDSELKTERNNLININSISFSTGYAMYHGRYDSIQKNSLRYDIADFTESLVKNAIPNIDILDNEKLLSYSYNHIMRNTTLIKARNENSLIKKVTLKNQKDLQLFIEIRSYARDGVNANTSLSFYVFDLKNNNLAYFDHMTYDCDMRDLEALSYVLNYGLNKLSK